MGKELIWTPESLKQQILVSMKTRKRGVHYRKMSHGLYVVWVNGEYTAFGNSRSAKNFYKTMLPSPREEI